MTARSGPPPVTVLGLDPTPLDPATLPAALRTTLHAAQLVVGSPRQQELVRAALQPGAQLHAVSPLPAALHAVQAAHAAGQRVLVLASGDPGFFGVLRRLRAEGVPTTVLPAVSSVARLAAALGIPWDDATVVSAHGRDGTAALHAVRAARGPVFVLVDERTGLPAVAAAAAAAHGPQVTVAVGSRLGGPDAALRVGSAADAAGWTTTDPYLVAVLPGAAPGPAGLGDAPGAGGVGAAPPVRAGAPAAPTPAGWALPDTAFEHRAGMITKAEVRAWVLAQLGPAPGRLIWDVGAGSGAVAVECGRLGAAVIAVERDDADAARVRSNAARHGVAVQVVHGSAPDALRDLPTADAVFVGGGGPAAVAAAAASGAARVVVALADPGRLAASRAALPGYAVAAVQLAAARLVPLADGHRLAPLNPVFVLTADREQPC